MGNKNRRKVQSSTSGHPHPSLPPQGAGSILKSPPLRGGVGEGEQAKKPAGNNGSSYFHCHGKSDQITEDVCIVRQHRNPIPCRGCERTR